MMVAKGKRSINGKVVAVVLIAVTALGVGLGVGLGLKGKNGGKLGDGSGGTTPGSSGPSSSPNATFVPDSRLVRSFWGMNYVSFAVQLPSCGTTLQDVVEDIKLLYQLTSRIKLYGMDCGQADLVFEALKILNINMGVALTIWVDNNATTYQRQLDSFWNVTKIYGFSNIIGVAVGNEAVYRKEISLDDLVSRIADMKSKLAAAGHPEIPVYTTEINNFDFLIKIEDLLCDNIHPYFGKVPVLQSANWTWSQFDSEDLSVSSTVGKKSLIAEVGWPSGTYNPKPPTVSIPSEANLQIFLDGFVCEANKRNIPYYYFELVDSVWKPHDDEEPFWGLFYSNRTLKPLNLPNCSLPSWTVGDLNIPQPQRLSNSS